MNYRRHHTTPVETPQIQEVKLEVVKETIIEPPVIVEEKKPEPIIVEEIKPPEKPVNTIKPSKVMLNTLTNNLKPKKKVAKKKKAKVYKVPKVIADEIRGLELNAGTGNIDSNVHTARVFKSICKIKGYKINKTLNTILNRWIKENS